MHYNAVCCLIAQAALHWVTALRCSFRSTCCLLSCYSNRSWRLRLNPGVHLSAVDVVKEWNKSIRLVFHLVAKVRNAPQEWGVLAIGHLFPYNRHPHLQLSKNGFLFGIFLLCYFGVDFKSYCCYYTYRKKSDTLLFLLLAVGCMTAFVLCAYFYIKHVRANE